jgi:hypothetical protein
MLEIYIDPDPDVCDNSNRFIDDIRKMPDFYQES